MPLKNWWLAALLEPWQRGGFGVYVHWPFCEAKCPYCDFNSHVSSNVDHEAWRNAYRDEIARQAEPLAGRVIRSVFFGGGTPSLMEPETVTAVLDALSGPFTFANNVEITLEANPTSTEGARFTEFARAGINRVSLGVQALEDEALRNLGRKHSVAEALNALDIARQRFDRISFDLIYARQYQTEAQWRAELSRALQLDPDHLSLYQLTIEPGTAFGARHAVGRLRGLPSEERGHTLYEMTQTICEAAGLPAYEVSNHAKPGADSRHNMIYWASGDYLGIGPGAHGRITLNGKRYETSAALNPAKWLEDVRSGCANDQKMLSDEAWGIEHVLMGLRMSQPYDIARLSQETGLKLSSDVLVELAGSGLVGVSGNHLSVTRKGRPLLNAILLKLLPD